MKYTKSKYEGIHLYNTKSGKKYRVRITYNDNTQEHSKFVFKTLSGTQAYKSITKSKLITEGNYVLVGHKRTFGQ